MHLFSKYQVRGRLPIFPFIGFFFSILQSCGSDDQTSSSTRTGADANVKTDSVITKPSEDSFSLFPKTVLVPAGSNVSFQIFKSSDAIFEKICTPLEGQQLLSWNITEQKGTLTVSSTNTSATIIAPIEMGTYHVKVTKSDGSILAATITVTDSPIFPNFQMPCS